MSLLGNLFPFLSNTQLKLGRIRTMPKYKLVNMMVHGCSPSTWDLEIGGSWVWGQPRLHKEYHNSLGYIMRSLSLSRKINIIIIAITVVKACKWSNILHLPQIYSSRRFSLFLFQPSRTLDTVTLLSQNAPWFPMKGILTMHLFEQRLFSAPSLVCSWFRMCGQQVLTFLLLFICLLIDFFSRQYFSE